MPAKQAVSTTAIAITGTNGIVSSTSTRSSADWCPPATRERSLETCFPGERLSLVANEALASLWSGDLQPVYRYRAGVQVAYRQGLHVGVVVPAPHEQTGDFEYPGDAEELEIRRPAAESEKEEGQGRQPGDCDHQPAPVFQPVVDEAVPDQLNPDGFELGQRVAQKWDTSSQQYWSRWSRYFSTTPGTSHPAGPCRWHGPAAR